MPVQVLASKPVTPSSASVGTLGSRGDRVFEVTAIALMRPSRMWPMEAVSWSIMASTWLPSRSVIAGPLPL